MRLTTVEYDLPSGDPDQHATKERLVHWVLEKARPGAIIEGLRARGFTLVTVSELLRETHGEERPGAAEP